MVLYVHRILHWMDVMHIIYGVYDMNVLELFSGSASFSKVAKERGHETFTVDNNAAFKPDMIFNLLNGLNPEILQKIKEADIIWMSPPCQTLSMAAGNTHWNQDRTPKTKKGEEARELIYLCKTIMDICKDKNKIYFIENPRARARWFLPTDETRHTVWYCQYGDDRAKPTDIWTNLKGWNGKICKNSNPDCNHIKAPRGSKTGTQGLKDNYERSRIPRDLCLELIKRCEKK